MTVFLFIVGYIICGMVFNILCYLWVGDEYPLPFQMIAIAMWPAMLLYVIPMILMLAPAMLCQKIVQKLRKQR